MHSRKYRTLQEIAADDFENQTCPILSSFVPHILERKASPQLRLGKSEKSNLRKSIRVDRRGSRRTHHLPPCQEFGESITTGNAVIDLVTKFKLRYKQGRLPIRASVSSLTRSLHNPESPINEIQDHDLWRSLVFT